MASTLVHTDNSPGTMAQATIDVSDLADGFPLSAQVVATNSGGEKTGLITI